MYGHPCVYTGVPGLCTQRINSSQLGMCEAVKRLSKGRAKRTTDSDATNTRLSCPVILAGGAFHIAATQFQQCTTTRAYLAKGRRTRRGKSREGCLIARRCPAQQTAIWTGGLARYRGCQNKMRRRRCREHAIRHAIRRRGSERGIKRRVPHATKGVTTTMSGR